MIMKKLVYNIQKKRWFTHYPWKYDRSALAKNEKAALKLLHSLERSLQKKPDVAKEYRDQI